MDRPHAPVIPLPGRFGRREAPRPSFRRPSRSRPCRSRRFRLGRWLLRVLTDSLSLFTRTAPAQPTETRAPLAVTILRPSTGSLTGHARVVDGDTLKIGRTRIRLHGIDAPESDQSCLRDGRPWRCGVTAKVFLENLIRGRRVTCVNLGTDPYGRMLALCRVDGTDLGAEMVRVGLAVAYRDYSRRYVPEERQARAAKRGLWATEFTAPREWRQGR